MEKTNVNIKWTMNRSKLFANMTTIRKTRKYNVSKKLLERHKWERIAMRPEMKVLEECMWQSDQWEWRQGQICTPFQPPLPLLALQPQQLDR